MVRDAKTGGSRGFGFAEFTSVEHARRFVDRHFPYLNIRGRTVRINYSKEEEEWTCPAVSFRAFLFLGCEQKQIHLVSVGA